MNPAPPRVLLICDPASERGMRARQRLDALGLAHDVVPAVFPPAEQPWSPRYDEVRRINAYGCPLLRGEVGCFLAHREAWRHVTEGPDELTLILEDDGVLAAADLPAIRALASAEALKEMVTLLFTISRLRFRSWRRMGAVSVVRPTGKAHSTVAYLVGKKGAAKLLAKSASFFCPVDDFLNMQYLHGVELFHTYPFLAGHLADTPSLIGPRIKPRLSNGRRMRRNYHRLIRSLLDGSCRLWTLLKMRLLFAKVERPVSAG